MKLLTTAVAVVLSALLCACAGTGDLREVPGPSAGTMENPIPAVGRTNPNPQAGSGEQRSQNSARSLTAAELKALSGKYHLNRDYYRYYFILYPDGRFESGNATGSVNQTFPGTRYEWERSTPTGTWKINQEKICFQSPWWAFCTKLTETGKPREYLMTNRSRYE